MRSIWMVSYDIADPTRLRRVHRVLRGYGYWMQFSVFRCELGDRERVKLQAALEVEIHHDDDQVLFAYLGPAEGRGADALEWLGRPFVPRGRLTVL